MALTKVSSGAGNQDVLQLVTPEAVDEVEMSISLEGMGHILARLTDLYTDPIEATAREVVSNGIDATMLVPEADRRPVEISLPSNVRTTFTVRDFGIGMSLETVKKIYSQYGASTKQNDMRQIGAYGLGAKAPLAYCTEFFVTTTHEGTTTEFTISRTAKGNFVKILSSGPSDLEYGTIVTIPVKMGDAPDFSKSVGSYRDYSFDVPISIDGTLCEPKDFHLIDAEMLLDIDAETAEETTGRVWVRGDSLLALAAHKYSPKGRQDDAPRFGYVLSGWHYDALTSSGGYYNREPKVLVELKPGVVDFTSSRDAVTRNDRSLKLENRIKTFMADDSAEALESILRLYRAFPKVAAASFFAGLARHGKLEAEGLRLGSGLLVGPDALVTDEGYSPLAPLLKTYTRNVAEGYATAATSKDGVSVLNPGRTEKNLHLSYFSSKKVGDASAILRRATEAGVATNSVAELLLLDYASSGGKQRFRRVVVVTDHDEMSVRRFIGLRKLFTDNDYHSTLFLFTADKAKDLQEQAAVVTEYTGIAVEFKKAATLLEEGKALRSVDRETRPKSVEETMSVMEATTGVATDEEAVTHVLRTRYNYKNITPEDLKREKAILVLASSAQSAASALIGAANQGVAISNRPIYSVIGNYGLKAAHHKSLLGYKGVIVGKDFNARSAAATKLAEGHTYAGSHLKSKLAASDLSDIVTSYLGGDFYSPNFARAVRATLTQKGGSRGLISVLKEVEKLDRYTYGPYRGITDADVQLALPPAEAKALLALRATVRKFSERNQPTVADTLVRALIEHRGKIEGPEAEPVLSIFVDHLESALKS